jgi:hypothetical protein
LASVAYLLAHAQIMRWIEQDPAAPRNPWLAAVPIVALLAAMVLAMRSVRGMDELERSIHTEAMAFGFLVSLLLICSAGFLALAGLVTLSLDWIAPAMVLSWVVGLLLAIMRYR